MRLAKPASLGRSVGAVRGQLSELWAEYKGWLFLAFGAYLLWSFRGLFTTVGDTVGGLADAATSGVRDKVQKSADNKAVKAATGSKVDYTDDQLTQFKADAETLAAMFGYGPEAGLGQYLFKSCKEAFSMLKQRYSRLNLHNNKPCRWGTDYNSQRILFSQSAETAASLKNKYNWKVLIPFYKAYCQRNLESDIRYLLTKQTVGADAYAMLKWIL